MSNLKIRRAIIYICLLAAAVSFPLACSQLRSRRLAAGRDAYLCIDNLRVIDTSKEWYAHQHGLKPGENVPPEALIELHAWPKKCPSGGKYTINPVGVDPLCSVPGHRIPKD